MIRKNVNTSSMEGFFSLSRAKAKTEKGRVSESRSNHSVR